MYLNALPDIFMYGIKEKVALQNVFAPKNNVRNLNAATAVLGLFSFLQIDYFSILFQIDSLYQEAALKFVHLALSCCHEKRKGRPKMSTTLAELNDIERMVAVAHGREPEESILSTGNMTKENVLSRDDFKCTFWCLTNLQKRKRNKFYSANSMSYVNYWEVIIDVISHWVNLCHVLISIVVSGFDLQFVQNGHESLPLSLFYL